jgi:hypothetical protein
VHPAFIFIVPVVLFWQTGALPAPANAQEAFTFITPDAELLNKTIAPLPAPFNVQEALIIIEPVDAWLIVYAEVPPPELNTQGALIFIVADAVLLKAKEPEPEPPVNVQFPMSLLAVVITPCAPVPPPITRQLEKTAVPVVAVTLRQVVVPARTSQLMDRTVDMVNTPPPMVAPAGVLVAVVRVASARAVPRFPDVPVPVDWKTVPTVLLAAPSDVQVCPPTLTISYH